MEWKKWTEVQFKKLFTLYKLCILNIKEKSQTEQQKIDKKKS